jgi:flagellin-like protein
MTKLHTKQQMISRRAVAPVIATLLLVAIAVVGGSIIFVFSQGFFSSAQISGSPSVESIEIVGYDASDVGTLTLHDGLGSHNSTLTWDGIANNGVLDNERVAIYVQNQSAQKVTLEEVRVAGVEYEFASAPTLPQNDASNDPPRYWIALRGNTAGAAFTSDEVNGELEAGAEATILVDLQGGIQSGRDAQFKITTSNGNIFVGTIVSGQQSG